MAFTKIDLIKKIARGVNALVVDSTFGTISDASSFGDKTLQFKRAEQLEGKQVYAYGSPTFTPSDAFIDIFVPGAIPTVKVVPSFSTTPTLNQSYLILDSYKIDHLREMAEAAIKAAGKFYFLPAVASIAVVATQYSYNIPSGFHFIDHMHFVPSSGSAFDDLTAFTVPRDWWTVENSKIIFNPEFCNLDTFDKDYIEIRGQARPALLNSDNDTYADVLEEYLVAYAIESLTLERMHENETWRAKYYATRDKRREEQELITTGVSANAVRTFV